MSWIVIFGSCCYSVGSDQPICWQLSTTPSLNWLFLTLLNHASKFVYSENVMIFQIFAEVQSCITFEDVAVTDNIKYHFQILIQL